MFKIIDMKLDKTRFSTWENIEDEDYQKDFDDELIIKVYLKESSLEIADYILKCQEKAEKFDKL